MTQFEMNSLQMQWVEIIATSVNIHNTQIPFQSKSSPKPEADAWENAWIQLQNPLFDNAFQSWLLSECRTKTNHDVYLVNT